MSNLVSIVIPVYRVEPYIRQALDSVVNQTYKNLQIILVDDGSPDNCGAICDEYAQKDSRIQVIHKENGGVSSARNAGIDTATGEWIYFMDPDDWIEPETLEICVQKALETGVDLILFDSERFDNTNRISQKVSWVKDGDTETLYDDLQAMNSFYRFFSRGAMWICFVKRSIIKDKLSFDEALYFGEDMFFRWELYPQLHSYLYIPHVLYHYRITPNSANNHNDVMKKINGSIATHAKIMNVISAGGYPTSAKELECGREFGELVGILANTLFSNKGIGFAQKREIIYSIVNMDVFKIAMINSNRCYLSIGAKIFLKLKHCPIFAIYLIHYLKVVRSVIKTIQVELMWSVKNAKDKN